MILLRVTKNIFEKVHSAGCQINLPPNRLRVNSLSSPIFNQCSTSKPPENMIFSEGTEVEHWLKMN